MLITESTMEKYYLFVKTLQLWACFQDVIIQTEIGLKQDTKVTIPAT